MIAIEIYVICIMYMFMYIFGSPANMETKPGAVTLLIKWTLLFYCCVFLCVFFKTIYKHRDFLIVSLKKHTLYIFIFCSQRIVYIHSHFYSHNVMCSYCGTTANCSLLNSFSFTEIERRHLDS